MNSSAPKRNKACRLSRHHSVRMSGFTLLEILVAIVVLAISLSALIQTTVINSRNLSLMRERTFAHWVAMNKLTELQLSRKWPSAGLTNGKIEWGGTEWGYTVRISNTPNHAIRQIEVEVFQTPERKEKAAGLTGFLPKPTIRTGNASDGSQQENL